MTATDANGATGTVQVPVIVVAAPAFASATLSRGFGNQGATDYTLPSVSGGVAPIVYAHSGTLPSGLNYDADANRITGTATTLGQRTNTTLTATDANGASASLTLSFEIVAAPRFASADDITFTIGTQKVAPLPIATGVGVVTYTIDGAPGWAAVTPSPPSVMPLTLTANASASDSGAIVTYSATDESEQTTPLLLTVVVVAAPNFAAQTELSFTAGTASNYALVSATAGAGDLIYSLSATPSGLTFDAATRRLHSTSSIAETASTNYTLTATDANGATGTVQVPVVVIAAPAFAADAVDDRAFGHQSATNYNLPNVVGGVAPINYSISGNLPRGLTHDAANNRITGSATRRSEVRMVTLTAVDTNGASAALMLTFRIVDAPRFASADDITFTIGTPKTAVLPSAAGDGVVTYALQGAPAWLAVTPSTATALVPFTFIATATGGNSGAVVTYTATDASEQATTLEINVIVVVAPNFAAQDELSFTAGTANAFTLNAASDGAGALTYSLSTTPATLIFNASARQLRSTTSIAETAQANYTLTATDANGASGTVQVPVVVIAAPAFANNALSRAFGHQTQTNYDLPSVSGGVAPIVYSISGGNLPGGLSHDAANNRITGTATTLSQSTTATLTATDANGASANLTLNFNIVNAPQFASSQPITFTIGTAKTVALPSASGAGVITYAIDGAPSWANVTPDASASSLVPFTFSATASSGNGGVTVTYTATDETEQVTTLLLDIVVVAAPNFAAQSELSFTAGTASAFTLNAASDGAGGLTYSLSTTPSALIFNASSRQLRSTTSIAATASTNYTLTATDANGATGTVTVPVVVVAAPAFASATLTRSFGRDNPINYALPTVSGGVAPIVYSISGGRLLSGLVFDAATNRITGTPTARGQTATATLTAIDANGARASLTLEFDVVEAPKFTSEENITFTVGALKTAPLPDASGAGDLTYAISGVPGWVTVTPDKNSSSLTPFTFSATASSANVGESEVTYTATDVNGETTPLMFDVVVVEPPTFSGAQSAITFTVGMNNTFPLPTADDGALPLTYAITPTLRNGVVLDANTAMISGAPTATFDPANYTLTATDANGVRATLAAFEIRVVDRQTFNDANFAKMYSFTVGAVAYSTGTPATLGTDITLPLGTGGAGELRYELIVGGQTFTTDSAIAAGLNYVADADNDNYVIRGAPTTARDYTLVFTSIDENNTRVSSTFMIHVAGALGFVGGKVLTVELLLTDFQNASSAIESLPVANGGVGDLGYVVSFAETTILPDWLLLGDGNTFAAGATVTGANNNPPELTINLGGDAASNLRAEYEGVSTAPIVNFTMYSATDQNGASTTASVQVQVVIDSPTDQHPVTESVLPELATTIVGDTIGKIADRIALIRTGATALPSVSIGGQNGLSGFITAHGKALADDEMDSSDLWRDASINIPLLGASAGAGGRAPLAFWMGGDYREISFDDDELDWSGDVGGLYVGVDGTIGNGTVFGVTIGASKSVIDYDDVGEDKRAGKGRYEIEITAMHPYFSWRHNDWSWWASLGNGNGEMRIQREDVDANEIHTNLSLASAAFGAAGEVAVYDDIDMRLRFDAVTTRVEVEKNEGIDEQVLDGGLARMSAQLSELVTLENGGQLLPNFQIGVRYALGDSDIGGAMEASGGARFINLNERLSGELRAHGVLSGGGEYHEWGVYAQMRNQPGLDGQGFSASLTPTYGEMNERDLWQNELEVDAEPADYAMHIDARVGFGLTAAHGLLTPFGEWSRRDNDIYRLGVDWTPRGGVVLNVIGQREQHADAAAEQSVLLKGEIKF